MIYSSSQRVEELSKNPFICFIMKSRILGTLTHFGFVCWVVSLFGFLNSSVVHYLMCTLNVYYWTSVQIYCLLNRISCVTGKDAPYDCHEYT